MHAFFLKTKEKHRNFPKGADAKKIDGGLFLSHLYSCFGVISCNHSKLVMEEKQMIFYLRILLAFQCVAYLWDGKWSERCHVCCEKRRRNISESSETRHWPLSIRLPFTVILSRYPNHKYACFTRRNLANHPSILFLFRAASTDNTELLTRISSSHKFCHWDSVF